MPNDKISYFDHQINLEAFVARPCAKKAPLVILCHAWRGRDEFICQKAEDIAQLGYVGFALDMYGKNILGNSIEENAALKRPFILNREVLQKRVLKAFHTAKNLPYVDSNFIAVLGFGFGGICALDLARSGVSLNGTISIYGHFDPPPPYLIKPIQGKVLIHHGYLDPIVPLDELHRFQKALTKEKIDWQTHLYGEAMHAFATPSANDPSAGILYHAPSAERAWFSTQLFLKEIFSQPTEVVNSDFLSET